MDPDSRGSAAVLALLLGAIVLAGSIWLFVAGADPRVDGRIAEARETSVTAGSRPVGFEQLSEADALSKLLNDGVAPVVVPADVRFRRVGETVPPPPAAESRVKSITTATHALELVISWEVEGVAPEDGFRVERLGPDGQVLYAERVPAEGRSYADELDAVRGERIYRITPVVRDGTVAHEAEKVVSFDLEPRVEYLGTESGGIGRFRLSIALDDGRLLEEFDVAPGAEIGEARPEAEGVPRMDWRTGLEFIEVRGRRKGRAALVPTPEFAPDGRVLRDEETGQVLTKDRNVQVYEVLEFARIRASGTDEDRWLQRVEN